MNGNIEGKGLGVEFKLRSGVICFLTHENKPSSTLHEEHGTVVEQVTAFTTESQEGLNPHPHPLIKTILYGCKTYSGQAVTSFTYFEPHDSAGDVLSTPFYR